MPRRLERFAAHIVTSAGQQAPAGAPALLGGSPAVSPEASQAARPDVFKWPIITKEDEVAVLDVMRNENMSGTNITRLYESEFAQWIGRDYCLAYPNGTMSILAAIYAAGVRRGDEVICPSMTYWGSCTQALQLGAVVVFADINSDTLCIDEDDIEHRVTPRTKAIVAVHYAGYPCAMDKICAIAQRHGLKVIEDVSHAHGGTLRGQKVSARASLPLHILSVSPQWARTPLAGGYLR
jgi:perosamine synthetase